jgi:hypothetical protein
MIHGDKLAGDQIIQVITQGGKVLSQVFGGFLEGNEDTRLLVLNSAPQQKLHSQHSLSASGAPAYQSGTAFRQSAAADFVKSPDAGRALFQNNRLLKLCHHAPPLWLR